MRGSGIRKMGKNGLCFCLFALLSSVERHPSAGFRPIKLNTPLDGGAAATDDWRPSDAEREKSAGNRGGGPSPRKSEAA